MQFQARSAPSTARSRCGRVRDRRGELVPAGLGDVRVGRDPELVGEPAPGRARSSAGRRRDGRCARPRLPSAAHSAQALANAACLRGHPGRDVGERARPGSGSDRATRPRPGPRSPPTAVQAASPRCASRRSAPGIGGRLQPRPPGARRRSRRAPARGSRPPGPGSPGTCSGRRARSSRASRRARRRAGRAPAPPGGVIASCPSQNGHDDASAIRVVRPCAPGRRERPGATMTGTPVSGLRRTSIRRRPFRASAPRGCRSGWAGWWSSCWCPRSRAASGGSAAGGRSGSG